MGLFFLCSPCHFMPLFKFSLCLSKKPILYDDMHVDWRWGRASLLFLAFAGILSVAITLAKFEH